MSKSQPSRRKQSRSTPRPPQGTKTTFFTDDERALLDRLANGQWPTRATLQMREVLRHAAFLIAKQIPSQERLPTRADIDENIKAFEL